MKIGIYARVSTSDGRQSVVNQLTPLREWAGRLGGSFIAEYVDEASGSRSDRSSLTRLLEDAHRRKFDTLLIWALDRLSREGVAQMTGYLERFKACGVRVLSHEEPWLDTAGPVSELLQAVFAWIAKQERQRIRERVKAGLKIARERGKKLGRPSRSIDHPKARKLISQGHSVRQVAQILGVPKSTVGRLLSQKRPAIAA